ncbi:MAG: helicase-associated domain-containing protein [Bacillota bacterium]
MKAEQGREEQAWLNALQGLTQEELAALKTISLEGGTAGITVELCHQRINQITGRRRQDGPRLVQRLLDRGLVERDRVNYREVYRLPASLAPSLTRIFLKLIAERILLPDVKAEGPREQGRRLVWDLVRFLGYLTRQDVRLTQGGQVFKRQAREILDLFVTQAGQGVLEGAGEGLADPLGFALSFCLEEGLVERADGHLRVTDRVPAWLDQPEGEVRLRLLESWKRRFLTWHRDLETALGVLLEAPEGVWVDLVTLARELEPLIAPGFRGPLYPRLNRFLLSFLYWSGFLEQAAGPVGPVGRLTPDGREACSGRVPTPGPVESSFLLQPNFELLIPPYLERSALWTLGLAADLVRLDQVAVYRLDRSTVYRALSLGLSESGLDEYFRRRSRTGVPANVAQALRDWSAAFGRLRFEQVCLLRCDTPDLASFVMASPRTGRLVQGRFSDTDLLVHPQDIPLLLEALRQDGHMPRPGLAQVPAEPLGQADSAGQERETGPTRQVEPGS